MNVVLDTNRYGDSCRGEESVMEILRVAEEVYLPFVVLGELRSGFLAGTRAKNNEQILQRFLGTPRVHILCADEHTTHHYAVLYLYLRQRGAPIPTNDIWIAALTVQHNARLCSRDGHFDSLPHVARI